MNLSVSLIGRDVMNVSLTHGIVRSVSGTDFLTPGCGDSSDFQ